MRYTRYNYKKKRNNDVIMFILKIGGTIAGAGVCGLVLAYIIFSFLNKNNILPVKNNNDNPTAIEANGENIVNNNGEEGIDANTNITVFYSVQCGYFSKEDNANQILNTIDDKYGAFIYEDNGKYRVLAGVYEESDVDGIMNDLKNSNIECVKVSYKLDNNDKVQNEISSICDGYLKVLNTAYSDGVQSINTEDFKAWTSKLEDVNEGNNVEVLKELKEYISNLPTEIKKENVNNEMKYIYNLLSNFNKM